MKLSKVAESKWISLTQKMQNLSSGGGSIFLEEGYLKSFHGEQIYDCTQKVNIKYYRSLKSLNIAWLSGEMDIEDRISVEKKDFYTVPVSELKEKTREAIEPLFTAINYESKIFIICADNTIKQGEFESALMTFNRDGSVEYQTKYCYRNRFFFLEEDEVVFDLEDEAYLYMMDKDIKQSSLQVYEYTSEIVDLMDKKFYIEYSQESKMYVPGKIKMVLKIEIDPSDEYGEYMGTILSQDNREIKVSESLMFSTTKEAAMESIARNKRDK